jgi:hypothetical protein
MPTDIAVAITRKRQAVELERNNRSVLLGCIIACLVVVVLICVSPTFACAVELLVDY